ncbi:MAG TPA: hypothetical protein VKR42_12950 [Ktedonobacteraceae bacterium]|nr:hypothetical protein [Ktedonobacteraceae bacterium]
MKMVNQHLQRYGVAKLLSILSTGMLAIFISAALAACGSSTASGGTATPTAQVQTQKCGTIETNPRGLPTDVTTAQQSEQCFYQAYQQCHNASLIYTLHGVDTSVVRTFTVENHNNQCTILDAMQHAIAPAPLSPAQMFQCSTMMLLTDGLHVSGCGQDGNNGTIILLSRVSNTIQ